MKRAQSGCKKSVCPETWSDSLEIGEDELGYAVSAGAVLQPGDRFGGR